MLDFTKLTSLEFICLHLRCTPEMMQKFVSAQGGGLYRPIRLRRRRKSTRPRLVYDVERPLRRIHKVVADGLRGQVDALPSSVQAYRKKASILKNAANHVGKEWIATGDIRDFYDNIELGMVVRVFERAGCSRLAAIVLARVCTLSGRLPQGARSSPAIANLAVRDLDQAFQHLAGPAVAYTRYGDDFTFSGPSVPARVDVADIAARFGFTLSAFQARRVGTGQMVTGLSVDNPEKRPRMPRWKRREIERAVHYAEKVGMPEHLHRAGSRQRLLPRDAQKAMRRLQGLFASYEPVEPALVSAWRNRLLATIMDESCDR